MDEDDLVRFSRKHWPDLFGKGPGVLVVIVKCDRQQAFDSQQCGQPERHGDGHAASERRVFQSAAEQEQGRYGQAQHIQRQPRLRQAEHHQGQGEPEPEKTRLFGWPCRCRRLFPENRKGDQRRQDAEQQRRKELGEWTVPLAVPVMGIGGDTGDHFVAEEIIQQARMTLDDHCIPRQSDDGKAQKSEWTQQGTAIPVPQGEDHHDEQGQQTGRPFGHECQRECTPHRIQPSAIAIAKTVLGIAGHRQRGHRGQYRVGIDPAGGQQQQRRCRNEQCRQPGP